MPRYIDADALYESTAEWEASALAKIEELNRTPLEEMTDEERAEWRRWTAILGERTAFKFDVADAPTIDVPDRKVGEWIWDDEMGVFLCSSCKNGWKDQPTLMGKPLFEWCPVCGAEMKNGEVE